MVTVISLYIHVMSIAAVFCFYLLLLPIPDPRESYTLHKCLSPEQRIEANSPGKAFLGEPKARWPLFGALDWDKILKGV